MPKAKLARGPLRSGPYALNSLGFPAAVASAVLLLAAGGTAAADAGSRLNLRCTNPASGASWPVVVDLGQRLVNSQPATIGDASISWRDPKGGIYELERSTGQLRFRNASSTGGYFLFYACRPE